MKKKFILFIIFIFSFFSFFINISASNKIIKTETNDEVIFISDSNGEFLYSWMFDKEEYKKNEFDFDLGIDFKSKNKDKINNLINKDMKKEFISFKYHGNLPSDATIKVPITKFKEKERLNLYYYNDKTNKIETIDSNIIVQNGYATFKINHCSDYFLTGSIVKEAERKNNNGIIIIGMIIVIVGLIGYTLFNNKK